MATCQRLGLQRSMSRTGSCLDNAVAESWFASLKVELPDDVQALAQPVLAHRIQPIATAAADAQAQVVGDAIAQVPAR